MNLMPLCLLLALVGCSTPPAPRLIETPQVRLSPVPASVMQSREADFLIRLQTFFSPKQ